jgi:NTE family protein
MTKLSTSVQRSSPALVLGSGGARGAYEVGAARFLFEDLPRLLGHPPQVSILCGTSAGALNAYGLASFTERPLLGVTFLANRWSQLRLRDIFQPDHLEFVRFARTLVGFPPAPGRSPTGRGLLAAGPFRRLILKDLPNGAVSDSLRSHRLDGVSVTATEVATGRTTVFVERRANDVPLPASHAGTTVSTTLLTPEHALASAAIPLLFAPIRIGGRSYCDGSLRQSVPLSPALHLGARRILVVSTQHGFPQPGPSEASSREHGTTNPIYLLGKAVNALTLDHVDDDIERLETTNDLLAAGRRAFGSDFADRLNRELVAAGRRAVMPVEAVILRPSQSLGRLAAEYVRTRAFRKHNCSPAAAFVIRLAEAESDHEADLASYLLFDAGFARLLMQLGYEDARSQSEALLTLFRRDGGSNLVGTPAA